MRGGTAWTKQAFRSLLSVASDFNFERESLSESWATAIFRKRRNVYEDIGTTLIWGDESEAAVIIPFGKSAVDAHMKGFTSSWSAAGRYRW